VPRTALADGPRAGAWAAAGSSVGNGLWGSASVLGVAAVRGDRLASGADERSRISRAGAFRRGLASDLVNVKVGLFWTALVPQFVGADSSPLLPVAMVAAMGSMVFAWLSAYAHVAGRMSRALTRRRSSRAVNGTVGAVLLAVGGRLARARLIASALFAYAARMSAAPPRWATFDCYGTLVDWDAGIRAQLGRLFGEANAPSLVERYHVIEPRIQSEHADWSYRDVMAAVLAELADEIGAELPADEGDALGRSLPGWPVFEEAPGALAQARERGWRLVALSNSDRDFIEASMRAIGVQFAGAIVASEIGSYKPAHGHWNAFHESTGADRARHVHVAQSHFHDIVPAHELGIPSVWINRLGERRQPPPTRELADLNGLADVLDELVPPA
jgi:2-haloacid dehalogenase